LNDPIIVTQNLSYTYHIGPLRKAALTDISLAIRRGSCVAIVGVTGSGKTTLVQHFNALLRPTAGAVLVEGTDLAAKGIDLSALRRRVAMLFQFPESHLFERTVFADVAFGPQRMGLGQGEVHDRVRTALGLVGLPYDDFAQRAPFALSGGQMRRVALAGLLAMSPSVLILDEPTAGLDATGRAEFYVYLRRVQREQGMTVVLVSHDMAEVAALADRLFVLHEGQLVIEGRPQAVFAHSRQLRAWGLAAPPLTELLALLRERGLAIPAETFTLEEAFAALQTLYKLRT
jgi:energy-coupling factor transport system ATP-binding protein